MALKYPVYSQILCRGWHGNHTGWLNMRKGDGGVQELKKTCLLQGRGGGLCIKYRKATRLVYAHYSQTDTDGPSPTEVSPSLSIQAHCHPAPIQNSSDNKELITVSWMHENGVWLDVLQRKWSQHTPDMKLNYYSLFRHLLSISFVHFHFEHSILLIFSLAITAKKQKILTSKGKDPF